MSEVAPRYVFCQKNAIQSGRTQNKFYYSARFGILLTHGHPPSPAIARGAVPAGGGGGALRTPVGEGQFEGTTSLHFIGKSNENEAEMKL